MVIEQEHFETLVEEAENFIDSIDDEEWEEEGYGDAVKEAAEAGREELDGDTAIVDEFVHDAMRQHYERLIERHRKLRAELNSTSSEREKEKIRQEMSGLMNGITGFEEILNKIEGDD